MSNAEARSIALECLIQWRRNPNRFISDSLQSQDAPVQELALARELAIGVVRYQRLYQYVAKRCLKQKSNQILLLDILSIAAHQIFMLDGIPEHAIGDTTVALTKLHGHPEWSGVVNAVVRKMLGMHNGSANKPAINDSDLPKQAPLRYSFSDLFIKHLQRDFPKQWKQLAQHLNVIVPVCMRLNNESELIKESPALLKRDGRWVWWSQVQDALPFVEQQKAVIQDRSQGYLEDIAQIRSAERVLDVCAAPGGKSNLAMSLGARVVSADLGFDKAKKLSAINPGRVFVQDACLPAVSQTFDCVIADVPCSNSGVFARKPEARWRYTAGHLNELIPLQKHIIEQASTLVVDDGRLIYATCSINNEENMQVCESLTGWEVKAVHLAKPDQWQAGGFAAQLQRV